MAKCTMFLILGILIGAVLLGAAPSYVWLPVVVVLMVGSVLMKNRRLQLIMLMIAFLVVGIVRISQSAEMLADELLSGGAGEPSSVVAYANNIRLFLEQNLFALGLDAEEYSVAVAMILGDKTTLDPALREVYSRAGGAHVLALSGMHLAILYAILASVLTKLPLYLRRGIEALILRRKGQEKKTNGRALTRLGLWGLRVVSHRELNVVLSLVLLLTMWSYVMLVGMSASVVRACVMLSVCEVARMMLLRVSLIDSLALATFLILTVSPLSLFDLGFQMSCLAVLGIALFYQPISEFLGLKKLNRKEGKQTVVSLMRSAASLALSTISLTLSAQILVLPLIAYTFHQIPCYGIITSLIVALTATIIVWLGMLSLIPILASMPFAPSLASVVPASATSMALLPTCAIIVAKPFVFLLNVVVTTQNACLCYISSLPFSAITDIQMSFAQMVLVYVVIAAVVVWNRTSVNVQTNYSSKR